MEIHNHLTSVTRLERARLALRQHLTIETILLEECSMLPEGTDTCDERYALQLGAGHAHDQQSEDVEYGGVQVASNAIELDNETLERLAPVFLGTRPYNRYTQEHYFDEKEWLAFVRGYGLVVAAVAPTQKPVPMTGS